MDYLTIFNTESEYNKNVHNLVRPNISLIEDTKKIIYLGGSNYKLFDLLHRDGTVDTNLSNDVIGICVIPSSHYGQARFMSVTEPNYSHYGGGNWGVYFSHDDYFMNQKQFTQIDGYGSDEHYIICNPVSDSFVAIASDTIESSDGGFDMIDESWRFPSNIFTDPNVSYMNWYPTVWVPSPFNADESLNTLYNGSSLSALSDVNGLENTEILISFSDTDAAKACYEFDPGYGNGKWYLPALGELGYLMTLFYRINNILSQLDSRGCSITPLKRYWNYWSSTENNDYAEWGIDLSSFKISGTSESVNINAWGCGKWYPGDVRPFIML